MDERELPPDEADYSKNETHRMPKNSVGHFFTSDCWCRPVLDHVDRATGHRVYLHQDGEYPEMQ